MVAVIGRHLPVRQLLVNEYVRTVVRIQEGLEASGPGLVWLGHPLAWFNRADLPAHPPEFEK